jgi:hypothetical protein
MNTEHSGRVGNVVGQVKETVCIIRWAYMAASTVAADRMMILLELKYSCKHVQMRVTRVTCTILQFVWRNCGK